MEQTIQQITEEIRKKLRESLPEDAISQHPTKKFLSTIKAIYIVERLNDVFGIGRWNLETEVIKESENYVLMRGSLKILDYDCEIPKQYGGHTTTGTNTELADGYKSAITDCLSKSASYLEIGIDVFKGKVKPPINKGSQGEMSKVGDREVVTQYPEKECPVCHKKHFGQYPKCLECFRNGTKETPTKKVVNSDVAPF